MKVQRKKHALPYRPPTPTTPQPDTSSTSQKATLMAKIIVVTSGKGGVGKTTTSASFSSGLALRGHKTAVIDFDVGLRNLDLIMGCERRVVYDLINVIHGEANLHQALIKDKQCDNLYVLAASQTRDKDALTQDGVERVLTDLAAMGFEYIVCDSPAGIETGALGRDVCSQLLLPSLGRFKRHFSEHAFRGSRENPARRSFDRCLCSLLPERSADHFRNDWRHAGCRIGRPQNRPERNLIGVCSIVGLCLGSGGFCGLWCHAGLKAAPLDVVVDRALCRAGAHGQARSNLCRP